MCLHIISFEARCVAPDKFPDVGIWNTSNQDGDTVGACIPVLNFRPFPIDTLTNVAAINKQEHDSHRTFSN